MRDKNREERERERGEIGKGEREIFIRSLFYVNFMFNFDILHVSYIYIFLREKSIL